MAESILTEHSHCCLWYLFRLGSFFQLLLCFILEVAGGTWLLSVPAVANLVKALCVLWSASSLSSANIGRGNSFYIAERDFRVKPPNFLVVSLYSRDQPIAIRSNQCHYFLQLGDAVSAIMNPMLLSMWSHGLSFCLGLRDLLSPYLPMHFSLIFQKVKGSEIPGHCQVWLNLVAPWGSVVAGLRSSPTALFL